MNFELPTPIVSTSWLDQHLHEPELRIVDATIFLSPPESRTGSLQLETGRVAHAANHIPGSQYADLLSDFSGPEGRFPRPDITLFASSIEKLGIGSNTPVVIYDRTSGIWAARLWWVMKSFGLERAAVLDGGFRLWSAEGRPTTAEQTPQKSATRFLLKDNTKYFVDRRYVSEFIRGGDGSLINALDAEDFEALVSHKYARPGRIPGSVNVPASSLIDKETNRLLPIAALQARFSKILADPGRNIFYCGGGIAACLGALALTLLGDKNVSVYDGSLHEWAADPSLPMEVQSDESSVYSRRDSTAQNDSL